MAYNFVSGGASAASAIEDLLVRRKAEARQRMLDEIMQQNQAAQNQDRAMNRKIQQASLESLDEQRRSMNEERQTGAAAKVAGMLTPDQPLDPATSGMLRDGKLGALINPGQEAGVVPPEMGEGPQQELPETFRGTPTQIKTREDRARLEQYLGTLDPNSNEAKALNYEMQTGKAAPAGMFEKQAQSSDITEYEYAVEQMKKAGQPPPSFADWQKQQANLKASGAGGGQPYFIPVTTGQGVIPFNARTGQFDDAGRKDLRPSATAEENITKAQSTLYQLDTIGSMFTPERVGPLKGRYNTMQLAVAGEMGDTGLAEMQAAISGLKNTVINLRTGAQMSEPEAARILQEVPDFNLPPDVFVARMNRAKAYFGDYLSKRAKLAFGRTTSADVDAMITGSGVTPAPSHTPAASGAAPTRRKFNPATGQLE